MPRLRGWKGDNSMRSSKSCTLSGVRHRLLLSGGAAITGALALAAATPAAAQDGDGDPESEERQASSGQGNAIVVTARRREESLQDTPIAISAFSGETLEERQVQTTQDLERIAPSLQFKPAGQLSGNTAGSGVFIRGGGQLDPTAAVDPGVGIYIDEVYVGRSVGGTLEFGDVASVEVLRG